MLLNHNPKVFILRELIRKTSMYEDELMAKIPGDMSKEYFRTLLEPMIDKKFIRKFSAYGKTVYRIEVEGKWAYEAYASDLLIN